jgi:2-aminoadipate transaminase
MDCNDTDTVPCFQIADRIKTMPRSGIREILMAAEGRKLISFGGGVPHDSCVPLDTIKRAFDSVMSRWGAQAFRYGASEGETELREYIAWWLNKMGLPAHPQDILVVNGSQQALDLLGKVLINRGARILIERPTYLAALQAFAAYGPEYDEVELDEEGPMVCAMKEYLNKNRYAFFYTIPSYQNPSGTCCGLKRRAKIVEVLNETGTLLIEDDPYSQLYFDSPPPPPLSAMGARNTVYMGTFSKMVSPGFRLGWVWSNTGIIRDLITVKQAADLCTGRFQQLLLCEVLKTLDIDRHLQNNRLFYTSQRNSMAGLMKSRLHGVMEWNHPEGGMFFWASLCNGLRADVLLKNCISKGVAFADGAAFYAGKKKPSTMRLNFTQCTRQEMKEGLGIIAQEIEKMPAG